MKNKVHLMQSISCHQVYFFVSDSVILSNKKENKGEN